MNKFKNYTIIEKKKVNNIDSECLILEHNKTKAKVLLMENDDNNKVFTISFRTPPKDSTGVAHILEHSVLCGSRKFPVKDPFVELMKGSLNTFLNAFTAPDVTSYPCASCNEQDFKNLMDVYLDAVFYPNIYKHEEIFKQEGWHYELENENDEININGVVYNEMKGAFSNVDSIINRESMSSLYPNTCYGIESGGKPEEIPNLTYQDFLAFHKKYYHPSNSYIVLYGNMDMEERLQWMDEEYLSKFDYLNVDSEIKTQEKFDNTRFIEQKYPVSENDNNLKCSFSYNICLSDSSDIMLWLANKILGDVLISSSSALLRKRLLELDIAGSISGDYLDYLKQPMVTIVAKDCDINKKNEFVQEIENCLKEIVKTGLDKKTLMATINAFEFEYKENESAGWPKGLAIGMTALGTWLYGFDPLGRLDLDSVFEKIKEAVNTNYFEKIIETYYINNPHKSMLTFIPDKTCALESENELRKSLNDMKKSLSEKEIKKLITDTNNQMSYSSTPSTKEELKTIPCLSIDDIKIKVVDIYNDAFEINHINNLFHNYQTNGIGYLNLLFDITGIEEKYLPYVSLMCSILGYMPTNNYSYDDLLNEIKTNTGLLNFSKVLLNEKEGRKYRLYVTCESKMFVDKLENALNLSLEIMYNTIYNDYSRLKELVTEIVTDLELGLVSSGHNTASSRALSYLSEKYFVRERLSGISYYDFMKDFLMNFESKKEEVVEVFKYLSDSIFTKERLLINYTCSKEYLDDYKKVISNFGVKDSINKLSYNNQYDLQKLNEGIKTSSNVQYVAKVGIYKNYLNEFNGACYVLRKILGTDYLWTNVRVRGGAYGCMFNIFETGEVIVTSYRDPNIVKTFKIYDGIVDYIANLDLSEEDLNKFILGTFGSLTSPLNPQQKGDRALSCYLLQKDENQIEKRLKEVVGCKLQNIKDLQKLIKDAFENGAFCVVGNENQIVKNEKLFENTRYLCK